MATEKRILIYFDELVTTLARTYKMTMDKHIYSPNDILSSMQGLTPVDAVEVVHGRWEYHDFYIGTQRSVFECNLCKGAFTGTIGFNYCPNCGAKMDAKEEQQ